ncbi:MAG: hypothetical protein AAF998_07545 [Bacteroidota bacterium]
MGSGSIGNFLRFLGSYGIVHLGAAVLGLVISYPAVAQLPLRQGQSQAASGMLVYDVDEADDMQARTYLYQLCPSEASCIELDFVLLEAVDSRDFIRVFDGPDRSAPLLAVLGGKSSTQLVQGRSGCLTFEFTRAESGLYSIWTAHWRSRGTADCIDPGRQLDRLGFQDVCAPGFWELAPLRGPGMGSGGGRWYRFVAQRAGMLEFTLLPNNCRDDLDWELYAGSKEAALVLPDRGVDSLCLARNFAAGAGRSAGTGMRTFGGGRVARGSENPFCRSLFVDPGDVFFLYVVPGTDRSDGFRLELGERVLACAEAQQDTAEVIRIAHKLPEVAPKVPARDAFSRRTSVIRIDLNTKANAALGRTEVDPAIWSELLGSRGKAGDIAREIPRFRGLVQGILYGVRAGWLQPFSGDGAVRPLHYGDLLTVAAVAAQGDSVEELSGVDWWMPNDAALAGYCNVIELVVEEVFDKTMGRDQRIIRFVRLIWTDWEGGMPDYNVALFPYEELRPLLAKIKVTNPQNEAQMLNLEDIFVGQKYESVMIWHFGRNVRTLDEGKFLRDRKQELQEFNWDGG